MGGEICNSRTSLNYRPLLSQLEDVLELRVVKDVLELREDRFVIQGLP